MMKTLLGTAALTFGIMSAAHATPNPYKKPAGMPPLYQSKGNVTGTGGTFDVTAKLKAWRYSHANLVEHTYVIGGGGRQETRVRPDSPTIDSRIGMEIVFHDDGNYFGGAARITAPVQIRTQSISAGPVEWQQTDHSVQLRKDGNVYRGVLTQRMTDFIGWSSMRLMNASFSFGNAGKWDSRFGGNYTLQLGISPNDRNGG